MLTVLSRHIFYFSMMKFFQFKPIFSIYVFLTFITFTIIGTLSHEFGHIAVAGFLGYETKLFYGSMEYYPRGYKESEHFIKLRELGNRYEQEELKFEELNETQKGEIESQWEAINQEFPVNETHDLLVTLGGPLQTIATSVFGLSILWYRRSKYKKEFLILDWLGVFLGLFILREVFNTVTGLLEIVFYGDKGFVGDEFGISTHFGLNQWVVPIITMLLGFVIALYIIFKVIPLKYRFSFILSGFLGGLAGFGIWFGFLGEMLFRSY